MGDGSGQNLWVSVPQALGFSLNDPLQRGILRQADNSKELALRGDGPLESVLCPLFLTAGDGLENDQRPLEGCARVASN
jgi:hypothetical protein